MRLSPNPDILFYKISNTQDKLDINGAEGGAPVLESIESIYEDIYLFKVGMGL